MKYIFRTVETYLYNKSLIENGILQMLLSALFLYIITRASFKRKQRRACLIGKKREKETTIPCSLNLVGKEFFVSSRRYGFRGFIARKPEKMNENVSKDATSI